MSYEHLDYRRDSRAGMTATEMQAAADDRAERRQHYLAQMANVGPVPVKPRTRDRYERPTIVLGVNIWNKPDATRALVPADAVEATRAEEHRRRDAAIARGLAARKARRRGRA